MGDKDPEIDSDEDDGIVPDVAASDQSMVEDILVEVELDYRLTPLSSKECTVGCLVIAKVLILFL